MKKYQIYEYYRSLRGTHTHTYTRNLIHVPAHLHWRFHGVSTWESWFWASSPSPARRSPLTLHPIFVTGWFSWVPRDPLTQPCDRWQWAFEHRCQTADSAGPCMTLYTLSCQFAFSLRPMVVGGLNYYCRGQKAGRRIQQPTYFTMSALPCVHRMLPCPWTSINNNCKNAGI